MDSITCARYSTAQKATPWTPYEGGATCPSEVDTARRVAASSREVSDGFNNLLRQFVGG